MSQIIEKVKSLHGLRDESDKIKSEIIELAKDMGMLRYLSQKYALTESIENLLTKIKSEIDLKEKSIKSLMEQIRIKESENIVSNIELSQVSSNLRNLVYEVMKETNLSIDNLSKNLGLDAIEVKDILTNNCYNEDIRSNFYKKFCNQYDLDPKKYSWYINN